MRFPVKPMIIVMVVAGLLQPERERSRASRTGCADCAAFACIKYKEATQSSGNIRHTSPLRRLLLCRPPLVSLPRVPARCHLEDSKPRKLQASRMIVTKDSKPEVAAFTSPGASASASASRLAAARSHISAARAAPTHAGCTHSPARIFCSLHRRGVPRSAMGRGKGHRGHGEVAGDGPRVGVPCVPGARGAQGEHACQGEERCMRLVGTCRICDMYDSRQLEPLDRLSVTLRTSVIIGQPDIWKRHE